MARPIRALSKSKITSKCSRNTPPIIQSSLGLVSGPEFGVLRLLPKSVSRMPRRRPENCVCLHRLWPPCTWPSLRMLVLSQIRPPGSVRLTSSSTTSGSFRGSPELEGGRKGQRGRRPPAPKTPASEELCTLTLLEMALDCMPPGPKRAPSTPPKIPPKESEPPVTVLGWIVSTHSSPPPRAGAFMNICESGSTNACPPK
mmetsp:Transcript_112741/g.313694  ORF Transcript_112741/g.313694 Transcript_112741/m.313694 type:complete len:200 (+) Transcript_112741:444-1043(+)